MKGKKSNQKKKGRQMSETEYRGYQRYHESVEYPVDREELKAKDTQANASKQTGRTKMDVKNQLRKEMLHSIEDLKLRDQQTERKFRGARERIGRKKQMKELMRNSSFLGNQNKYMKQKTTGRG